MIGKYERQICELDKRLNKTDNIMIESARALDRLADSINGINVALVQMNKAICNMGSMIVQNEHVTNELKNTVNNLNDRFTRIEEKIK